jgi:two-component system, sensor histidine kinase LadS
MLSTSPIQRLSLWSLFRLWAVVCLLLPGASWAQDHILERAFWTDDSATASFEQARAASYTPYTGVLGKGFGSQAQWIRLKIGAMPADGPATLVLRIRPVFLDHITLYDPAQLAQGRAARSTGDRTPLATSEFESLNHTFVIPAQAAPRDVWLRLVTTSTQLIHVEALTPREMLREEHRLWLVYSGLLALIFSCLVWVLLAWLRDHDAVNGAFVLRQTVLLLYTACYLGYHRILLSDWLTPFAQDALYSWLALLTTGLSLAFEYRFLSEYTLPRWGHALMRGLLGCSGLALLLMLLDLQPQALHLNTYIVAGTVSAMFLNSLRLRPRPPSAEHPHAYQLPQAALVVYYLLILSTLVLALWPALVGGQGSVLSIYGVLLYGLVSGLLMSILLVVRSRQMERIRQEVANSLFLSREQLASETRRRQDQSQLLNMLMHELKTPLAVIDLALKDREATDKAQSYVGRAIDNMKAILNRCVQTDRLVERPFEVQVQHFDLAQQLQQWLQDNKQAEGRIALQALSAAPVVTDLQCTQIIVSNLIENAVKYSDPQQAVQVTLQAQTHADGRSGLSLQVRNAPGVAGRPDPTKVFDKYYRSAAAQRQSGTGLGLFLSHNLAQQIGAELRYLPTDSHICFELWLPT